MDDVCVLWWFMHVFSFVVVYGHVLFRGLWIRDMCVFCGGLCICFSGVFK